jgi:hypothetical protein
MIGAVSIATMTVRDYGELRGIQTWVGTHRWDGAMQVGTHREVLYDPADPVGGVLDPGATWLHQTHLPATRNCKDLTDLKVLA